MSEIQDFQLKQESRMIISLINKLKYLHKSCSPVLPK